MQLARVSAAYDQHRIIPLSSIPTYICTLNVFPANRFTIRETRQIQVSFTFIFSKRSCIRRCRLADICTFYAREWLATSDRIVGWRVYSVFRTRLSSGKSNNSPVQQRAIATQKKNNKNTSIAQRSNRENFFNHIGKTINWFQL